VNVADMPSNFDPQSPPPVVPAAESKSFLASTTGRVVIALTALFVIAAAVGVVVWLNFFNSGGSDLTVAPARRTNGSGRVATSTAPAAAEPSPTDPPQRPLESSFTFRNVFAPTLKAPTVLAATTTSSGSSTTSTSTSGSSSTTPSVPADTLYLQSIQTSDGERTATFIWNGETFTVRKGETLSGTPWKVVQINENSADMLYGDSEVTLSVAQGLSK
jgi:type IV pilus biogenesis protein PilP